VTQHEAIKTYTNFLLQVTKKM